jgi:oligopeptidase A
MRPWRNFLLSHEMTAMNPLLSTGWGLTPFDSLQAEHVGPAVTQLLAEAEAALERAVSPAVAADYDALSLVLDVATERLGRAWSAISHLNAVANTPDIRAAYNEHLAAVTGFYTRLGAHRGLYAKYKAVAQSAQPMSSARRRALTNALRDFVLSGAELEGEPRERFAALRERRAELSQRFSERVLDATDGFTLDVGPERLGGLPDDVINAARATAEAAGVGGHRFTLHAPSYLPVMRHAQDRELRRQMYTAYVTRASERGDTAHDNSDIMAEILSLRQEEAQLLGHATFADLSLVSKMASSPQEVMDFLRDLARRARPQAQKDYDDVRSFAHTHLGLNDLQAWDVPFASERLKESRYAYSESEVKSYFTVPRVLAGLFQIIETLFDVRICEDRAAVWHPSVQFYQVQRVTSAGTQVVAHFYLDLYARPGKRPGAWMDDARARWQRPDLPDQTQTPVAHLVCNFPSPQGERPALLTHSDVITLFHEFGHGLHHMLTQVSELAVSGIGGVEWDAVELPSQFMENFCWEWDVVRGMTGHVDTGEPLPRALYDKMLAARNYQSGLATLRQVEFALFDMRLHAQPRAGVDSAHIQRVLDEVRQEVSVVPTPDFNRFQHAFSHIFAGGYAAGYYSYKWAEVLSADAFEAFEESGVLNPQTGLRYRREVLEAGGSRPALESFKAFRGRAPRMDALLRHQGIVAAQPNP